MQKQYFSQFVTGVLLLHSSPFLLWQRVASPQRKSLSSLNTCMPVISSAGEYSQSRIQIVSSMHEGAWITLEGNVVSQQQDEWYTFRDPTGTIKVRIRRKSGTGSTSMLRTWCGSVDR
jgi:hypothetical protein